MKLLLATAILSLTAASARTDPSLGEPGAVWKSKNISVCWGKPDDTDRTTMPQTSKNMIKHSSFGVLGEKDRKLVQDTINREYNTAATGMEFTGWRDCTVDDTADVIIFSSDLSKGVLRSMDDLFLMMAEAGAYDGIASIGIEGAQSGLKQFVHIKRLAAEELKVSQDESLQIVALHEFGHLAGLRHEHARFADAHSDANCAAQGIQLHEARGKTAKAFGVYDPNSIMNYCHIFTMLYRTGLNFYVDVTEDLRVESSGFFLTPNLLPILQVTDTNMADSTLFSSQKSETEYLLYQAKIGLSKGDRHTLQCLYRADAYDPMGTKCNEEFKP